MKTQSKFYKEKYANEKQLLEVELLLKSEFKSMLNGKSDLINSVGQLPVAGKLFEFQKSELDHQSNPNSLIQSGIQLYKSIKEISRLTQHILKQIKS